jgi:hypothetical protein
MKKRKGIWTVQEFQENLEDCVKKGFLPLPVIYDWNAKQIFETYNKVDNKSAKQALLIQLAYVLVGLRLRNPSKRFEKILETTGIKKEFADDLLRAYTNQKEGWK